LKISEDFFKKAEIRLNVGEGTNLERLTAKVQFTEAQSNLDVANNEFSTALSELNFDLGNPKNVKPTIKHGIEENTYNLADSLTFVDYKINIDDLYKSLVESNPEIKIAELNTDISAVEKSIAWSSILPNINLAYFKQTRDGGDFYGTSAGISIPLWFMFEQKGKIQEAKANQSISDDELQSIKNTLALKLQSAVNDYENNIQQVELYRNEILPQTDEILTTATKSYDAGEITYMEYMQAKQTSKNSQTNYINVLLNYYQSLFAIEEIVGKNIIDK
jgi:outer membrane protein TolC